MSLVLSGNAAHVTTPLLATIIGMANNGSGLIRVQTSAAHHYATDDYVSIITTGTVINTYFVITIIDATHFDLVGSAYTGTGTGTAKNFSLTPQIQVPTDGDTFSLQLSGMLSALQALADRTQALAKTSIQRTTRVSLITATGQVVVPPWAASFLMLGWGGGGGGGGGMGGRLGFAGEQYASGGGGAGAKPGIAIRSVFGATRLDVVIGAGGAGGAGSAGAASPASAAIGSFGTSSTVTYTDGTFPGASAGIFSGGSAGGGGSNDVKATATSIPVYTPGGDAGPAGFHRSNASEKRSHTAPGPRNMFDIDNAAGVISVPGGAWPVGYYTGPIGQMSHGEGGASMATAGFATYAAGLSYDGAPSEGGFAAGGTAGTEGAAGGGNHRPGAAGGGGGAGPFGAGGNGGNGGAGGTGVVGSNGTAGAAGAANSGGGGGGGGGGGYSNTTSAGNGAAGGAGGSGAVWIIFFPANA